VSMAVRVLVDDSLNRGAVMCRIASRETRHRQCVGPNDAGYGGRTELARRSTDMTPRWHREDDHSDDPTRTAHAPWDSKKRGVRRNPSPGRDRGRSDSEAHGTSVIVTPSTSGASPDDAPRRLLHIQRLPGCAEKAGLAIRNGVNSTRLLRPGPLQMKNRYRRRR